MTVDQVLASALALSPQERKELVKRLVDTLDVPPSEGKKHSLLELRGLGREIWEGIDAQEYIDALRDEWDRPR